MQYILSSIHVGEMPVDVFLEGPTVEFQIVKTTQNKQCQSYRNQ